MKAPHQTLYATLAGEAGEALVAVHYDKRCWQICWLGFTDLGKAALEEAFLAFYTQNRHSLGTLRPCFHPLMGNALSPSAVPLPVLLVGSPFQHGVWQAVCEKVPYGTTTSYSALAKEIDRPHAARAVGQALAKNPVCWLVPCHRVLPLSPHTEDNYRWGKHRKHHLIALEKQTCALQTTPPHLTFAAVENFA